MNVSNVVKGAIAGATIGLVTFGLIKAAKVTSRKLTDTAALGFAAKAVEAEFEAIIQVAREHNGDKWPSAARLGLDQVWQTSTSHLNQTKTFAAVQSAIFNRFQERIDAITNQE